MVRRFRLICDSSAEIPSWNSFSEFHIMEPYSAWGKRLCLRHFREIAKQITIGGRQLRFGIRQFCRPTCRRARHIAGPTVATTAGDRAPEMIDAAPCSGCWMT
jgi:hypothetical protein